MLQSAGALEDGTLEIVELATELAIELTTELATELDTALEGALEVIGVLLTLLLTTELLELMGVLLATDEVLPPTMP